MYRSRSPERNARSPLLARLPLLFSAALLLVPSLVAEAGVSARFETRDLLQGTSESGRLLAQDGHYRMDRIVGEKLTASVLIVGGKAMVIDHEQKVWSLVDDAALARMKADLQHSATAFDQKLAEMEPKQREAIMSTVNAAPIPSDARLRELEATGKEEEKSGFPCKLFRVMSDGTLAREIWATPWSQVPAAEELQSAQSAMEAYHQRLTSVFTGIKSQLLGIEIYNSPENPFEDFGKIDGFAVSTRNFADGRTLAETLLLEIKEEKLEAKEFEIPAGFAKKAMNQ